MGMDVSGKNPTTEAGAYFRNNVWWWRPLAEYVCEVAPDITAACEYWGSNDGGGLEEDDAKELAAALREEIASGRCKEYAEDYEARRKAAPRIPCRLCDATGARRDTVGVDAGFLTKTCPATVKDEDGGETPHPRAGQAGWCNACDGRGTQESYDSHYPFSVANVEEFCTFLEGCGGFEIW
jgi:hypothetical protein